MWCCCRAGARGQGLGARQSAPSLAVRLTQARALTASSALACFSLIPGLWPLASNQEAEQR